MVRTGFGALSSTVTRLLGVSLKALLIECLFRLGLLCYTGFSKFEVTRMAIIPSEIAYQYNYPLAKKETVPMAVLEPIVILVTLAVFILARVIPAVFCTRTQFPRLPPARHPRDVTEAPYPREGSEVKRDRLRVGCLADFFYFMLALSLMGLSSYCAVKHLKVWIARPRPDFLARCYRLSPLQQTGSLTLLGHGNNEGIATRTHYTNVLAAAETRGPQFKKDDGGPYIPQTFHCPLPLTDPVINDGLQSFPSGHSACAWSVGMFCFFYLRNRWRVQQRMVHSVRAEQPLLYSSPAAHYETQSLPPVILFTAGIALFLGATFVSCSRVSDYKHHPLDVIAGGVIGAILAALSFWLYYPLENTMVRAAGRLAFRNDKDAYESSSSLVESPLLKRSGSWVADDIEGIKGNGGLFPRNDGLGVREVNAQADPLLAATDAP